MRREKQWIGVVALTALTTAALFGGIGLRKSFTPISADLAVEGYKELGITEATKISNSKGTITGYRVVAETKGFAEEPIVLAITFDAAGEKVSAIEVVSHKETEGYGSKITNEDFLNQFIGVELPVYLAASKSQTATKPTKPTPTKAPIKPVENNQKLQDGVYVERAKEAHNGYISEVVLTIEQGTIVNVVWDAYDEEGNKKSILSKDGKYVMTETGLLWADQAAALANYVIENQGTDGLTLDEEGKTDAVTGVSISINEFVDQVALCLERAETAKKAKPATTLVDGFYQVRSTEAANGYFSEVSLTVEQGRISSVIWDQIDESGNYKSVLSETGAYVMTEYGPTWAEQAKELATNVIENQGIAALSMDAEGKTDAIATVSISINEFVAQVEECLNKAAAGEAMLQDGLYVERASEPKDGYTSQVTLTVENGKISAVNWENIAEDGSLKSVLAQNGEYVMTETGLNWSEQANALAAYVIEHQGLEGLTIDDAGKTDAVAGVSISIGDFINQTKAAITRAATAKLVKPAVLLKDGNYQVTGAEPHNGYTSQVSLTVKNGRIHEILWDALDEKGVSKRLLADTGEYVMTENGPTWTQQANAIATSAIENQGINHITLDAEGKTDAVASVSISVNEFAAQVEECLSLAGGQQAGSLQDGVYTEKAQPENGYTDQVSITVENGTITKVVWDSIDAEGNGKVFLSQNGSYTMTPDGLLWADQAKALAAYVIEHQGIDGLTLNEEGKTDGITGVSISITPFVNLLESCLTRAANAKVSTPTTTLSDGVYEVQADEPKDGYTSKVSLTVKGGRIVSVIWDCIDENGQTKRILSQNGSYIMTEQGLLWADQAEALATYVIETQGIAGLTMNDQGKTDVVAGVSISINEFVAQVEECLKQAAGESGNTPEPTNPKEPTKEPTTAPEPTKEPEIQDGTQVDAITGASFSSRGFVAGINNAFNYIKEIKNESN